MKRRRFAGPRRSPGGAGEIPDRDALARHARGRRSAHGPRRDRGGVRARRTRCASCPVAPSLRHAARRAGHAQPGMGASRWSRRWTSHGEASGGTPMATGSSSRTTEESASTSPRGRCGLSCTAIGRWCGPSRGPVTPDRRGWWWRSSNAAAAKWWDASGARAESPSCGPTTRASSRISWCRRARRGGRAPARWWWPPSSIRLPPTLRRSEGSAKCSASTRRRAWRSMSRYAPTRCRRTVARGGSRGSRAIRPRRGARRQGRALGPAGAAARHHRRRGRERLRRRRVLRPHREGLAPDRRHCGRRPLRASRGARSTRRRAAAARRCTSPAGSSRCCPKRCPTDCAPCARTKTVCAWRARCRSTGKDGSCARDSARR